MLISFIVIYKAFTWRFDQHVRFWYVSHIRKYLGPSDCSCWCSQASHINSDLSLHLYIHTLCMQTSKALVSLHIYKARLSPHFLTLQCTNPKSNVLAHLSYALLLVIIYLVWFKISKALIGCNFITMIMFPCGMLSTKLNIKPKLHC